MHNPIQPIPRETARRAASLAIEGDILSTNADSIRARLSGVLHQAEASGGLKGILELDIRGARMIDSVGLNLLVWLVKKVGGSGGRVRLVIADSNIERTLQFTRLDQYLDFVRQPRD